MNMTAPLARLRHSPVGILLRNNPLQPSQLRRHRSRLLLHLQPQRVVQHRHARRVERQAQRQVVGGAAGEVRGWEGELVGGGVACDCLAGGA